MSKQKDGKIARAGRIVPKRNVQVDEICSTLAEEAYLILNQCVDNCAAMKLIAKSIELDGMVLDGTDACIKGAGRLTSKCTQT